VAGGGLETPDGVGLWYRQAGPLQGASLVVPGATVDADLDELTERHRVAFYDSRNRGRSDAVSDPTRIGFDHEVDDAETVRRGLGIERTSWLGWSYLAGVVVRHALAHPVRVDRLVLVSPIGPAASLGSDLVHDAEPGGLARLDQLRAAGLDRDQPQRFCEEWRAVYLPLQVSDPASLQRMRSRPCEHPNEWPAHVTAALAHVFIALGDYDWRPELAALDVPALVVHGADDVGQRDAAVAWVTALPNARLLELDGVLRLPWLEAPQAFFGAVSEFLAGRWPAAARR
jgi:proline iminopeptidase